MFSYIAIEDRIPTDHPLRTMRALVDPILRELSPRFAALYAEHGRPSPWSDPPDARRGRHRAGGSGAGRRDARRARGRTTHALAAGDGGRRSPVRRVGLRHECAEPGVHAAHRPATDDSTTEPRGRADDPPSGVRHESATPESDRGEFWLGENGGATPETPASWDGAGRLGVHLHDGGVQPGADANAAAGHRVRRQVARRGTLPQARVIRSSVFVFRPFSGLLTVY